MDKQVTDYIRKQSLPQKEILQKLRKILLKTFPGIKEEIKMGVPWYEGRFYLVALKDHVNFGFCISGLTAKERELFEGKGKLMRHLKFFSLKEIDEKKITKLVKLVMKKGGESSCL